MLMEGGFELTEEEFQDMDELCRDLERRRVAAATPEELAAAKDAPKRLLKRATPRQASRHLERIEIELANGNVEPSKEALRALVASPAVRNEPALYAEAMRLLGDASRRGSMVSS